jgi:ribosome recycling factor
MSDVKSKMQKSIDTLKEHFATVRTGRANPDILSKIQVDYYGSMVPIKQVASISVPEPMTLMLTLFDKGSVKAVEKAIMTSDLGLNPAVDGTIIRLRFPDLTEDRRKELAKLVKKMAEDSKIALRNIRRDAIDQLKADKAIPEDQLKKQQDDIQKDTDHFTKLADQLAADKEAEIMKI